MVIDRKTVEHIAKLARLGLTDAEAPKTERELGGILAYVEKLQELDTSAVEPTAQVGGLENAWRDDDASRIAPHNPKLLRGAFPKKRDGFLEVEAVFEE